MKMKKLIAILGTVFLLTAIAYPVFAHGPEQGRGGRHMMGHWGGGGTGHRSHSGGDYETLTEEQRGQMDKLYQKFYDETAEARSEIWAKSAALNTLLNTSDPDTEKVKALQKEISDLRANIAQERINLELEERKITPDARIGRGHGMGGYGRHMMSGHGPGMGYGRHMMSGYGPGMGYGRQMGGYGPGSCWN
jgi:Spy/CpxP family protein refolding chaperone